MAADGLVMQHHQAICNHNIDLVLSHNIPASAPKELTYSIYDASHNLGWGAALQWQPTTETENEVAWWVFISVPRAHYICYNAHTLHRDYCNALLLEVAQL